MMIARGFFLLSLSRLCLPRRHICSAFKKRTRERETKTPSFSETTKDDPTKDERENNNVHHGPHGRCDPEHGHVEPSASYFLRDRAQGVSA